jgi:hypothetical protein
LGKYKYDTWRIISVKCYIDNSVRLRSCIRNINSGQPRTMQFFDDDVEEEKEELSNELVVALK